MENLYQILQCDENADYADLKKSYSSLALKYHPDKAVQADKDSAEMFCKISKAWKILSDPQLREEYNIRWRERCLSQTYPIQDTVDFEDFEMVNEPDLADDSENVDCPSGEESCEAETGKNSASSDGSCVFVYLCRCGGRYVLTETDVEMKFDFVCCDSCSLTVQVLYSDTVS